MQISLSRFQIFKLYILICYFRIQLLLVHKRVFSFLVFALYFVIRIHFSISWFVIFVQKKTTSSVLTFYKSMIVVLVSNFFKVVSFLIENNIFWFFHISDESQTKHKMTQKVEKYLKRNNAYYTPTYLHSY